MKKTLMLILVGIILGSSATFATSKIFSDVSADSWYADAVNNLSNKNILNGYPNGTFGPDQNVNRAELAVIIDRLMEYNQNGFVLIPSELPADEQAAYAKCKDLNGNVTLAFDELLGASKIACSFNGEQGQCTSGELASNSCFMETNKEYKSANEKCAELGGLTYFAYTDQYPDGYVFCSFGNAGECTQNELNSSTCSK